MKHSMLWFDNSTTPLEMKIERAAAYYRNKYHREPNACGIPPATENAPETVGAIAVRPDKYALPCHFFVGVDEQPQ